MTLGEIDPSTALNSAPNRRHAASELASREFPELDVSFRRAISIARRLQDPLAELVKIEPKAIGVGQHQHDVDHHRLGQALNGVVEDAVNAVGADLNTASTPPPRPRLGRRPVGQILPEGADFRIVPE